MRILRWLFINSDTNVVKVENGRESQMADGHLGLGSNVQLDLVDLKFCAQPTKSGLNWPKEFKVCDRPPETSFDGQSQTLKSCWPIMASLSWLSTKL